LKELDKQPGSSRSNELPPGVDESALVRAVLRKDRKATAEFVSRYADPVYAYVRSRLSPRLDLVDDLVQEVFLAAWEGLGQFRGFGSLQAWILGIACHKVESYYRACLRDPEPTENEESGTETVIAPEYDSQLDQEQLRNRVRRVLSALPEPYRLVLLWRYWEKCSARDMASKTGKTEKAIERLLARARTQFRQRWNRE
jgi:RNA polymerase sigma-70 factor, ECF subfamily